MTFSTLFLLLYSISLLRTKTCLVKLGWMFIDCQEPQTLAPVVPILLILCNDFSWTTPCTTNVLSAISVVDVHLQHVVLLSHIWEVYQISHI